MASGLQGEFGSVLSVLMIKDLLIDRDFFIFLFEGTNRKIRFKSRINELYGYSVVNERNRGKPK